jgi:ribonuclease P protein component
MVLGLECPPVLEEISSTIEEEKVAKSYQPRKILQYTIHKITKLKDYKLFYSSKLTSSKYFVIYYLDSKVNFNYGITVNKKIGNAVIRNKYKRIIKCLVQHYTQKLPLIPLKVNITARQWIIKKGFAAISHDFYSIMNKVLNNVYTI